MVLARSVARSWPGRQVRGGVDLPPAPSLQGRGSQRGDEALLPSTEEEAALRPPVAGADCRFYTIREVDGSVGLCLMPRGMAGPDS